MIASIKHARSTGVYRSTNATLEEVVPGQGFKREPFREIVEGITQRGMQMKAGTKPKPVNGHRGRNRPGLR